MKPRILVVDDEEFIRDLLKDILTHKGYDALSTEDYAGALEILDQTEVDLILADIILSGKTGIDLLETVKTRGLHAPVIMVTGQPQIDTVMESLRLGAFDYVTKPIQTQPLMAAVKKAVKHKQLLDRKQQLEIENKVYSEHLERLVRGRTAELEKANERLRKEIARRIKAQKLMQIQRDLGLFLNTTSDLKDAVSRSFEALFKIDGLDAAGLYLIHEETHELILFHHAGISEAFAELVARYDPADEASRLIFRGKPVYTDYRVFVDEAEDPRRAEALRFLGIVPVTHEDQVIAALHAASHTHDRISDLSVSALETVASQLGGVIARLKAETALRKSDERRNMALEASSEGTWDYNFRINEYFLGPRWYTILGYAPYELPQSFDTLKRLIHPDDYLRVKRDAMDRLKIEDAFAVEFRMKTKNGDWRWILARGKVFERDENGAPMRVVGTNADITEKKTAEAEILRTNLELDQIFNSTSDGMCLVNGDYAIVRINRAMLTLFDWDMAEVLGKNFFNLFSGVRFNFVGPFGKDAVSRVDRIEHDFTARRGDGTKLYLVLTSTPLINVRDEIEGMLFNIRDVTRRVTAEEEARVKEKQLIQADKMKSLGILVSGMAHEISNPNNFIMLNVPLLAKSWQDIEAILEAHYETAGDFPLANIPYSEMRRHIPELLGGIQEGANRIKKIISSLKDYARGGTADLTEDVDLNKVIREALLLLENQTKKSTRRLAVTCAPDLPLIKGSFHQAEQVMINLIQNACQALTHKDQAVRIATSHDPDDKMVIVTVADEGRGIPEEDLDRLFDPFFTTKSAAGGCGLGLSICAGIVKEHGGNIAFTSAPGKGACATLRFPAATAPT